MPRSRRLARQVRHLNRALGPVFIRLPGFGYLHHRGRRTGCRYRTPLRLLSSPNHNTAYIALTYGTSTDWYLNMVAGPTSFEQKNQLRNVARADLVDRADQGPADVRLGVFTRFGLRVLGVEQLVRLVFEIDSVN